MDNLIGKTLDGLYTIQELIGAGGMANVYKAVCEGTDFAFWGIVPPSGACARAFSVRFTFPAAVPLKCALNR